jgi:2-polyprenyl-3-methyl-5-hydroxy-6-metoxy-1,4-benzoquinol methylase
MFKHRSQKKELLDGDVSQQDLVRNLKELHSINTWLGGYNISTKALSRLDLHNKTLVDIGSGGGDMLEFIRLWSENRGVKMNLYGVDLKEDCINYAHSHLPKILTFIRDDYRNVEKHIDHIDYLHACLFTHHLSDEQIVGLIRFALKRNITLIINDLERNALAYYAIKLITTLFSKSHLVRNDAPLSVLRGFKKKEWLAYLEEAGATRFSVKWKWAFRHQIVVYG